MFKVVAIVFNKSKEAEAVTRLVVILGEVIVCTPVKVLAASVLAIVAEVDGNVIVVLSVPASVIELLAVRVFPSRMVKVEPVAGAVNVTLLIVVAEATPRVGVTRVGEVEKTTLVEAVPVVPVAEAR